MERPSIRSGTTKLGYRTIAELDQDLERKRAEGKSRREAIRCLKRLLVRVVLNTLKASPALT